ncbi:hypothetical protein I7I53_01632 [Histoplasma capsulatum var. duboisii H88]|uniref:Uncharacterized protein n=1 Tax=Ajellomyces capsulatus (strain H88) TaxID=544711 RepID=A0A8A1LJG6_AJEC8|nr:hypothetical protein I7I53_01632 [Histoplasma capsulatum var. duboisii H88]
MTHVGVNRSMSPLLFPAYAIVFCILHFAFWLSSVGGNFFYSHSKNVQGNDSTEGCGSARCGVLDSLFRFWMQEPATPPYCAMQCNAMPRHAILYDVSMGSSNPAFSMVDLHPTVKSLLYNK